MGYLHIYQKTPLQGHTHEGGISFDLRGYMSMFYVRAFGWTAKKAWKDFWREVRLSKAMDFCR